MTEAQKLMRRLERKAAAANAKLREELPLFVGQVPAVTKQSQFWRWRRQKATNTELDGIEILDKLKEAFLRRLAFATLPAAEQPQAYRERTYPRPGSGYGSSFWMDVLTTCKRVVLKAERQDTGETFEVRGQAMRKVKVIETETWPPEGWTPPFTIERIGAIVTVEPPRDHPDPPGPSILSIWGDRHAAAAEATVGTR